MNRLRRAVIFAAYFAGAVPAFAAPIRVSQSPAPGTDTKAPLRVGLIGALENMTVGTAQAVEASGYLRPGLGAATYVRDETKSEEPAAGRIRSRDGVWFRLSDNQIVRPEMFGALGDGISDDGPAIQAALDWVAQRGRRLDIGPGTYRIKRSLRCSAVSLIGAGAQGTRIIKTASTGLSAPSGYGELVCYPGALPNSLNAVLVLDGPNQRYQGRIAGLSLEGVFERPGDYESQNTEFGIVAVNSVSDTTITECLISNCVYGIIIPSIFVSEIYRNRIENCLHGIGLDGGTSTPVRSNYANNCRDWGYYMRSMNYSIFTSNACDFLNDPVKYKDRTRLAQAYIFNSVLGLNVTSNGQEQTHGRNWTLIHFDHSIFESNMSIGLGSDYTGPEHIAWIYSNGVMRGSVVRNNFAFDVNPKGLLWGGARRAHHHNLYLENQRVIQQTTIENNFVRPTRTGFIEQGGWGGDSAPPSSSRF